MTDDQSNQLDMLLILKDFYTANQVTIDAVPILALNFPKLATNIAVINSNLAGQSANIKGVAQTKTNLRTNLNELTFNILGIARAWAVAEGNATLAEEFKVTESGLEKIKDDTVAAYCTHRYILVNDNLASMADYGITAATMTTWQDAITDYESAVATPREAVNTRSTHTSNLKTVFDDTMKLLKENIDPVMLNFKTSDPDLYNGYTKARIVIDRKGPGGGTDPSSTDAKLSGQITDANTLTPIVEVAVTLTSSTSGTATPPVTVLTDVNGNYVFEGITPGGFSFLAEKVGYESVSNSGTLGDGESAVYDFQMTPVVVP
ncbi:MAG: hypothetical protein GC178_05450 [Flavobacteriales bacterium]|nr:hypothetical protein [Flavobacteriales bacterium]